MFRSIFYSTISTAWIIYYFFLKPDDVDKVDLYSWCSGAVAASMAIYFAEEIANSTFVKLLKKIIKGR